MVRIDVGQQFKCPYPIKVNGPEKELVNGTITAIHLQSRSVIVEDGPNRFVISIEDAVFHNEYLKFDL